MMLSVKLKMNRRPKSIIKKIVPKFVLYKLWNSFSRLKTIKAKKIFEQASERPIWLGCDLLEHLQRKYPFSPPTGYDPESLQNRGKKRAEEILSLIPAKSEKINTFLELGCWDGMVSCGLQRKGKKTTAIDNRTKGFDERALSEGVALLEMDAAHLQFEDESFDFIFSYDSFEHFYEPEIVLQEAIRVVKRGGYIYLFFGPMYMSAYGLHIYNTISVPYCQFLFSKELLKNFVKAKEIKSSQKGSYVEKNVEPFPFETDNWVAENPLNGWSLEDYRRLFSKYSHRLKKIKYYEILDPRHVDLIQKYPSCFKSKTKCFDNLIVSDIEVLFKKIG